VVVKEEAVFGGKKLAEDQERILEENGQCQILNRITGLLARRQSKWRSILVLQKFNGSIWVMVGLSNG
jgi:hypothetical protein